MACTSLRRVVARAATAGGKAATLHSGRCRLVHSASFNADLGSFELRLHQEAKPLQAPALVLRDLCQCETCWDPHSHQRKSARVPTEESPRVNTISTSPVGMQVLWADGHASRYETSFLQRFLQQESNLPRPRLWNRTSLPQPPQVPYAELVEASGVQSLAHQLHVHGICVLRDAPTTADTAETVGDLLGAKRATSMFGTVWDLRVGELDNDSAYSLEEIEHHTDGCYLPQRPPLQLFHCIQPGAEGTGVSSLIDGFAVAQELRRRDKTAYEALTKHLISYQFRDERHDISAEHPVLQLNLRGELVAVHWNNYDRATLPSDPSLLKAMQLWDSLLQDESWHLDVPLQRGDMLIIDNLRLLHARKGRLRPGTPRHFYGFYLDAPLRTPRALPRVDEGSVGDRADLRSDTKTKPDGPMYSAMVSATLGDDVAGECETTRELESYVATLLGKEAALLVCSGTQGNLLAAAAQCPRGTEMLLGNDSHIHLWEAGGPSVLFGVAQRTVAVDAFGQMPISAVEASLALSDPEDDHCCRTRLVAAENPHGARGGAVLSPAYMKELVNLCRARGIRLHVDGARIFNAAAAVAQAAGDEDGRKVAGFGGPLGEAARQLLDGVDTVSVCLSKGLGCPGGAVIAGDAATVAECRRLRKLVGGSMRQATGMLAAAGLHALRERDLFADLKRDHELMRRLVEGAKNLQGVSVDLYGGTNMAVLSLSPDRAAHAADLAKASGLRVESYLGQGGWRFVTHRGVREEDVDALLDAFGRVTV
eukprot:CAMPEP_0115256070 /NCGR_PEP_ID=MMETSP0270-20121206/46052_1 /TAXON_ID=71861 /ORGANISM="Scrippsiella trochoidea, Strain CCMP3099" /LENGTH=764 /DNA_ID=CAMNT_0002671703 /DNA_START=49 /DNA_END=2343 /DNA_ORIENTATION=-